MISAKKYLLCIIALIVAAHTSRAQFSKATVSLTGTVTSAESGAPLHVSISFIDPSGNEANKVRSNTAGTYYAVLKPGTQYTARITCSQFYQGNETVSIPATDSHQDITQNFTLQPIKAGTVMFDQDCFDQGSETPRSDAATALAVLGAKMKANDEMEVSVETFSDEPTENDAPAPADQGTKRADAIKAILVSNGAPANRVTENPHNPPPAVQEDQSSSKKKKAKKKKVVKKKSKKGKQAVVTPPAAKATITITKVHSDDE
ncbi:MAG TPA: carboxypeptidase-like regulatory domain-containing protein [Candidatus Kapabacteria bacterium]|nr:carboxypeptidase-like regulatory domain-containing protein [Candidatus Kapabacteria bacterium]